MSQINLRVCSFVPSLFQPESNVQPFAMVVGGERNVALVGIDLSSCGLQDHHPVGAEVLQHSFDLLSHRLEHVLESQSAHTGHDVVELIGDCSPSNIQFSEIHTRQVSGEDEFRELALRLYAEMVGPNTGSCQCEVAGGDLTNLPRWRKTPRINFEEALV